MPLAKKPYSQKTCLDILHKDTPDKDTQFSDTKHNKTWH
jgi:hypothetical protein